MKVTLNPLKSRRRFSIDGFSEKSALIFSEKFNHKKTIDDYYSYYNFKTNKNIENKVKYLNDKFSLYIDAKHYTKGLKDIDSKRKFIIILLLSIKNLIQEKLSTNVVI
ncbi:MAG: hypothetical protein A2033_19145 [Bacteroidetes bacterium GWA2_31_9]|nr:MAG: hypothetical protein A2033_19145 [Bacteroidetes bacterium GWA2_31_9]